MTIMKMIKKYFSKEHELNIDNSNYHQKRYDLPTRLVIHHSAGNPLVDKTEFEVQDAFNSWGEIQWKEHFKVNKTFHMLPIRNIPSYCPTQYALHKYKGMWRLVSLMRHPISDIAWHAGKEDINRESLGIEICGDYTNKRIENAGLQAIANIFRPYHKYLQKHGKQLIITGHKDHMATICPGKIYEQLHALRTMILF